MHELGQLILDDQPGADRILDVVVEVGQRVRQLHDLPLEGGGDPPCLSGDRLTHLGVFQDAFARLRREVEASAAPLEELHDAE